MLNEESGVISSCLGVIGMPLQFVSSCRIGFFVNDAVECDAIRVIPVKW